MNKKSTIKDLIKSKEKLYTNVISQELINSYINFFHLDLNQQIKKMDKKDQFLVSLLLSLIKNPKLIITDYKFNFNIDLTLVEEFFNEFMKNTQLVILTNSIDNLQFNIFFYNLEHVEYYENNPNLTIFTEQPINYKNKKTWKQNCEIFMYIFKKVFYKNWWYLLMISFLCMIILTIALVFNFNDNRVYPYIISYGCLIISCFLMFTFSTLPIFFKHNKFLINLNIEGFNHVVIVLFTTILDIIVKILPLALSIIFLLIFYYTLNIVQINVDLNSIYILIISYVGIVMIMSLLSSIQLRVNLNKIKNINM